MLRFRYFYAGTFYLGFARRYNILGEDKYLIVLPGGITLTIARISSDKADDETGWYQVTKDGESVQENDLVQILGAALKTAKEF